MAVNIEMRYNGKSPQVHGAERVIEQAGRWNTRETRKAAREIILQWGSRNDILTAAQEMEDCPNPSVNANGGSYRRPKRGSA